MPKTVRNAVIVLFVDFKDSAAIGANCFTKIEHTRKLELQVPGMLSFITTESMIQNRAQFYRDLP